MKNTDLLDVLLFKCEYSISSIPCDKNPKSVWNEELSQLLRIQINIYMPSYRKNFIIIW